jgi:hypothetical protein
MTTDEWVTMWKWAFVPPIVAILIAIIFLWAMTSAVSSESNVGPNIKPAPSFKPEETQTSVTKVEETSINPSSESELSIEEKLEQLKKRAFNNRNM